MSVFDSTEFEPRNKWLQVNSKFQNKSGHNEYRRSKFFNVTDEDEAKQVVFNDAAHKPSNKIKGKTGYHFQYALLIRGVQINPDPNAPIRLEKAQYTLTSDGGSVWRRLADEYVQPKRAQVRNGRKDVEDEPGTSNNDGTDEGNGTDEGTDDTLI